MNAYGLAQELLNSGMQVSMHTKTALFSQDNDVVITIPLISPKQYDIAMGYIRQLHYVHSCVTHMEHNMYTVTVTISNTMSYAHLYSVRMHISTLLNNFPLARIAVRQAGSGYYVSLMLDTLDQFLSVCERLDQEGIAYEFPEQYTERLTRGATFESYELSFTNILYLHD